MSGASEDESVFADLSALPVSRHGIFLVELLKNFVV
jgi:hypothetical protein